MKRWINILIIWLIAITIPIQGMASVAMMNCAQTPNPHQQELAKHQHDMQHGLGSAHAHSHDPAQMEDQPSQGKANTKHACAHCVKCTNCCSGFTFQSIATHLFQQLNVKKTKFYDQTLLFTGFVPSGLERPPRLPLV